MKLTFLSIGLMGVLLVIGNPERAAAESNNTIVSDFCYRVQDGCDDTRVQLYAGINSNGPDFAWSRQMLGLDDLFAGDSKRIRLTIRDENFCYRVEDGCDDTRVDLYAGIDGDGLDLSWHPFVLGPDGCPPLAPCIPVDRPDALTFDESETNYLWAWQKPKPIDFAELVKEQVRLSADIFDGHDCDYTRSDCGQLNGLSSNANPFWVSNGAVLNEYSLEPAGSEEIEAFSTADISWEELKNWRELLDVEHEGIQASEYKHVASMTAQTVAVGFLLPAELVYATVKTSTGNVEEGAAAFQLMAEHTMQALNGLADQERRHREEQQRREEEIRVQQEMLDAMEIERVTRHEPLPDDVAEGHHDGVSEDGRSIQLRAEHQSPDELPG